MSDVDKPAEKRYLMRFDSAGRKTVPLYEVLFGYFPDAMVALAEHSYKGNQKHNPGETLHHARTKSMDHENCIMRHLANHEGTDGADLECVALLWRAAALCQENLERRYALTVPYRVVDPRAFPQTNSLVGPSGEQATGRYEFDVAAMPRGSETKVLPPKKTVTNVADVKMPLGWEPTSPRDRIR